MSWEVPGSGGGSPVKMKERERLSRLMYWVAKLAQIKMEKEMAVKQAEMSMLVLTGYKHEMV